MKAELVVAEEITDIITVDLDPSEFGIEVAKIPAIQSAFIPKLRERAMLDLEYERIITSELTPKLCKEAKDLRNKYVKTRTSLDGTRKTEKDFYFQTSKYIDALAKKLILPGTQKEETLKEIEQHFELIEAEKKRVLQEQRVEQLLPYVDGEIERDLTSMEPDVWESFLAVKITQYEERIAEEKRLEEEKLEEERKYQLHNDRKYQLLPYWSFLDEDVRELNFSELEEENFMSLLMGAQKVKAKKEKEAEDQRKEVEKLRKEAEAREAKLEVERKEAEKKLAEENAKKEAIRKDRASKMQPYLNFIRDYEGMISSSDKDFEKHLADIQQGWKDQQVYEAEQRVKKEKADRELAVKQLKQKEKEKAEKLKRELAKKSKNEQIKLWVESFKAPETDLDNETVKEILSRFDGFKSWAKGLTES